MIDMGASLNVGAKVVNVLISKYSLKDFLPWTIVYTYVRVSISKDLYRYISCDTMLQKS